MYEEEGGLSKYFTYPKDGTKKEIPVGDTKINFNQGEISLPDGTTEQLHSSLRQEEEEWIRSVFIETNKDIKVWLDEGSLTPIAQDDYIIIPHINFKVLWIRATEASEIAVWASTDPNGVIKKIKAEGAKVVTISGEITHIEGYDYLSGDWRAIAVTASGEIAIHVTVADIVRARISGDVVKISGEVVKISGEKVHPITASGDYVVVSGNLMITSGDVRAHISGDVVKISGETIIAKISGEIVKISGEAVGIVAPALIRQGYTKIGSVPPLSGSTYLFSGVVLSVKVCNLSGNNPIWLGGTTVNSGDGLELLGEKCDEFDIDNLNDVYLYAYTSGQLVSWRAVAEP